jgi:hypothetical protein
VLRESGFDGAPKERTGRNFRFNPKGKYVHLANQMRQDSLLEDLKQRIAESAKKAGLDSEFETLEKNIRVSTSSIFLVISQCYGASACAATCRGVVGCGSPPKPFLPGSRSRVCASEHIHGKLADHNLHSAPHPDTRSGREE